MENLQKTVEEFRRKTGYELTIVDGKLHYEGSLDLYGCTGLASLPSGLTVAGYLNLEGCTGLTSLPEGLVVGDSLDLEGCTGLTSLPEGLVVAGSLNLYGTKITDTSNVSRTLSAEAKRKIHALRNMAIEWERNGRKYIKVDGIFSVVDSHHGNVWRVHQLGSGKQMYIVTDGEYHYAHGDTIEEARKDLVYKICDRDKSEYEHLTLDSELTYAEAIECYRVITGACSAGTQHFCENILTVKKDKYTIREMIELTEGQYRNEIFREFFMNK